MSSVRFAIDGRAAAARADALAPASAMRRADAGRVALWPGFDARRAAEQHDDFADLVAASRRRRSNG